MLEFKLGKAHAKGMKLSELYARHVSGDEYAVADAINLLRSYIDDVAYSGEVETGIPAEDFVSHMLEAVCRAFDNYEPKGADFVTFLCRYVNKAAQDVKTNRVAGGLLTYAEHHVLGGAPIVSDEDGKMESHVSVLSHGRGFARVGGQAIACTGFESLSAPNDVENEVINRMCVEEGRNILDDMLSKCSDEERELVEAALFAIEKGASFNAVAKTMGMHPQKFMRELRKVAKYYDADRFGDASDYYRRTFRLKAGHKTNGTSVPIAAREVSRVEAKKTKTIGPSAF